MAGVNTGLCSNRRLNQERQGVSPAGPPLPSEKMFEERVLGGKVGECWRAKYGCFDGVSSFQLQENPHDVII